MSFDLFFKKPQISSKDFVLYFESRPLYKVSSEQAFYENRDTGVYFFFNYADEIELNINYFRPHYFILEIEPEVTEFIKHFNFTIYDPQSAGMGDGPYTPEGLLKSWNHGNEFGYAAILNGQNRPQNLWSQPTDRLEATWRWNYTRAAREQAQTVDRFIPQVFFLAVGGKIGSVAVWPDAISELVPETDFLVIGRDQLAPKTPLGQKAKDHFIVPFSIVRDLLDPYYTDKHPLRAFELPAAPPPKVGDFIKRLQPSGLKAERVRFDQVLNEELIQKPLQS